MGTQVREDEREEQPEEAIHHHAIDRGDGEARFLMNNLIKRAALNAK